MDVVYVLQHVHETPNGDDEDVKMIGVYSSEQKAQEAIARVVKAPGFREHPDGFHIDAYEVDRDNWTEGFTSWDEANEAFRP